MCDDEIELPKYTDPGRILFHLEKIPGDDDEIDVIDYDADKAPFWLNESGFMDLEIRDRMDLNLELSGYYVIEGVRGHVYRSYDGEHDEEWTFDLCRRASEDEIKSEALSD